MDLEFGPLEVHARWREARAYYSKHRALVHAILALTLAAAAAAAASAGCWNIEMAIADATAVTLDEPSYTPFAIDTTRVLEAGPSATLVPKTSQFNLRAQVLNLARVTADAREYLAREKHTCVHLQRLGAPFDIVVYDNETFVNPEVLRQSDEVHHVWEMGIDGIVAARKRPRSLVVRALDAALVSVTRDLHLGRAACLLYYLQL